MDIKNIFIVLSIFLLGCGQQTPYKSTEYTWKFDNTKGLYLIRQIKVLKSPMILEVELDSSTQDWEIDSIVGYDDAELKHESWAQRGVFMRRDLTTNKHFTGAVYGNGTYYVLIRLHSSSNADINLVKDTNHISFSLYEE